MINIQNIDNNECFKWILARCLNPADHNPRRTTKGNKALVKNLDFRFKDRFKINGKQRIMMSKKGEYFKFKNCERKIKSPFMIYTDFESVLFTEDNGKQNPEESYTNKYKKHIACFYGYKLVCVADKFNNTIEESKYCSDVMKKHFNKELVMTKEDNEDFKDSIKYSICDNDYVDNNVEARDHCHITGNNRVSANRYCNVNIKLNHKISVVFHNLRNYDYHFIMQKLEKLNLKVNVILNELEKYMRFTINNKLSFIDSLQFLSSLLHSSV